MTMDPLQDNNRLPGPIPPGGVPVEAFNPLLRSLLSWDLVRREDDGQGGHHWVLIEAAQHRLDALTPQTRRPTAKLAYLDHWCARCRQQRLTHLVDGRYLCEECEALEETPGGSPPAKPRPRRSHPYTLTARGRRPRP